MDVYEVVTFLQVPGEKPKTLRKVFMEVEYETDDRNSFVYTRTRKIKNRVKPTRHKKSIFDWFSGDTYVKA